MNNNLETISEQRVVQFSNGDLDDEEEYKILVPLAQQVPKRDNHSLVIHFPQYDRFSKNQVISKSRGFTHVESFNETDQSEIEISPMFAWFLMLMNVLAMSLVPCWLMSNLAKEPHTRNSWRYLIIAALTLPLVMYEKRRIEEVGGNIFQLITADMLRMNYIAAVNFSIQYWFLIEGASMTSLTHAVTLTSMKFFIISLVRYWKKGAHHELVKAGIMLVIISCLLMIGDSFFTSYDECSDSINPSRYWRLFGDIFCIAGSVSSGLLTQKYQVPAQPRYLNLFFQNLFISLNYVSFGYYFGGSELSFNQFYGVFGLFNSSNFVTIFYVGIMLGFNVMLTNVTLSEIYSPFILAIAQQFVPLVTAVLYHLMNLQIVPAYTYLSLGFFTPGMILILTGENAYQNKNVKMNFIVYKPQAVKTQQIPNKFPSNNDLCQSRNRLPSIVEMQEINQNKRKISHDFPIREESKKDKEEENQDRIVSI